jgi:predicted nucleotidyltransferase
VSLHPGAEDLVRTFAERVRPVAGVTAFWVAGSLASGDYRPGVSDLDLVALVAARLDDRRQHALVDLHEDLVRSDHRAAALHCDYVAAAEVDDVTAEHLRWAHGELYRHPLSGIARAELLRFGLTLHGPVPRDVLPPVSVADLAAAVRGELTGYWADALRKPHLWLQDVYVDIGLFTLARAEATLHEGRLITKQDALPRLAGLGVDPGLVAEITQRRHGQAVHLSARRRLHRARLVREVMTRGIADLTQGPPPDR